MRIAYPSISHGYIAPNPAIELGIALRQGAIKIWGCRSSEAILIYCCILRSHTFGATALYLLFSILSSIKMSLQNGNNTLPEKHAGETHVGTATGHDPATSGGYAPKEHFSGSDPENLAPIETNALHQDLKGRHMQMIAM
jgi:hypothetical protein